MAIGLNPKKAVSEIKEIKFLGLPGAGGLLNICREPVREVERMLEALIDSLDTNSLKHGLL